MILVRARATSCRSAARSAQLESVESEHCVDSCQRAFTLCTVRVLYLTDVLERGRGPRAGVTAAGAEDQTPAERPLQGTSASALLAFHTCLFGAICLALCSAGRRSRAEPRSREAQSTEQQSNVAFIALLCSVCVQPYVREISSSLAATHFKRFLESDRYTR